jgi:predicted amidophosphoribosyltransferase
MVSKNREERHAIATQQLREAIRVTDARRTRGKAILVYDDVFTDGNTLNEVARRLRLDGAATRVVGITLARQPWTQRTEDTA